MKNLFKTLITVLTVVCMLSSMTAFAATQTTVTTYKSDTSVDVATTVSGVAADVIVTYLVADSEDATIAADEIKYINQATANGTDAITFSYAITGTMSAGNTIADVQFGSDDADTAAALNDDEVIFDEIEFIVKDATGNNVVDAAEMSKAKIGKGDEYTNVVIEALPGYRISSIKIGGALVDETLAAHTVKYGDTVEVGVVAIEDPTVYLFKDATVEDGYKVYDAKEGTELSVVTGVGYYVGGPVDGAHIKFDGCNIDGAHPEFEYAASIDKKAPSGYFAVQLASANAEDLKPATEACIIVGEDHIPNKK